MIHLGYATFVDGGPYSYSNGFPYGIRLPIEYHIDDGSEMVYVRGDILNKLCYQYQCFGDETDYGFDYTSIKNLKVFK